MGLNQDIEIRIRLATYFAKLSDDDYKKGWDNYLNDLILLRNGIGTEINEDEKKLADLAQSRDLNNVTMAKQIQRELGWKYGELGYAPPNQDVANVMPYSFSLQLTSLISLQSKLKMLTDAQFVALAKAMQPNLEKRAPQIQALVKSLDPNAARLTGNVQSARQVINAWLVEDDLTPANQQQWLDAINSVTLITIVETFPKATTTRAEAERERTSRLESGAKSCDLTADKANWILTTVWPPARGGP
jgi:hypothetical protein